MMTFTFGVSCFSETSNRNVALIQHLTGFELNIYERNICLYLLARFL